MTNPTMRSVVWQKAIAFVEAHSLLTGAIVTVKAFAIGLLTAIVTAADTSSVQLESILAWRHGAIVIGLWLTVAAFYGRRIYSHLLSAIDALRTSNADADAVEDDLLLEGIPVTALIEHLVSKKTFRRNDIETAFGTPRYRYSALAKKLHQLDVLEHGVNNMFVLAAGWDRARLENLFAGKESADELEKQINIVRPLPSPGSLFKIRRLSEDTANVSHETRVQPAVQRMRSLCATA